MRSDSAVCCSVEITPCASQPGLDFDVQSYQAARSSTGRISLCRGETANDTHDCVEKGVEHHRADRNDARPGACSTWSGRKRNQLEGTGLFDRKISEARQTSRKKILSLGFQVVHQPSVRPAQELV